MVDAAATIRAIECGAAARLGVAPGTRIGILAGADGRSEVLALAARREDRDALVVVASSPRDLAWTSRGVRVVSPGRGGAFKVESDSVVIQRARRLVFDDASEIPWSEAWLRGLPCEAFVWLVCEPDGLFRPASERRNLADVLVSRALDGVAGPLRAAALHSLVVRCGAAVSVASAEVLPWYAIQPRAGARFRRKLRAAMAARDDPRAAVLGAVPCSVAVGARAADVAVGHECVICLETLFASVHAGVPGSRSFREPAVRLVGCCDKRMCASCFVRLASDPRARCPACRADRAAQGAVAIVCRESPPAPAAGGIGRMKHLPVRDRRELHVFARLGPGLVREIEEEDPRAARVGTPGARRAARLLATPRCLERLLVERPTDAFERAWIHVPEVADAANLVARVARLAAVVHVVAAQK